jgi:type II secretory pathway component GspD/PulD (secretin)
MPIQVRSRRKSVWPIAAVWAIFCVAVVCAYPQTPAPTGGAANSSASAPLAMKPDAKKAKEAFAEGQAAEAKQDWSSAFENYDRATEYAPSNKTYAVKRENAKATLVQTHVDAAEKDAVAGKLDDARRELLISKDLDPTNTVIRDRLAEFLVALQPAKPTAPQLLGEPLLDYRKGTQNINYRGDTRGAYDAIARQFGVEDSFDPDMNSRPVTIALNDVDFVSAMRVVGQVSGTFWRPLTTRMFFVTSDTPQKRRDIGESAVRTILLPTSESPDQMTETLRVTRDITGITRASLDAAAHTITLRASPQAIAVASNVIDGMQEPLGELVLEVEVLEVDKNYARQLGVTPPQKAQAYSISPQELQQASQSSANLVSIISQIFGLPTSLSGLSPTQIAGLLASGNLGAGTLIPPLVAFGGGESTFLATLPGATANFSTMLSLVKHGTRMFVRAEDGQPATIFFGEHFPVSLANYSSSLGGTSIPGVSSSDFPTTNYNVGTAPQFVTSAVLRNASAINDLIVTNEANGNVGVLLGNGVTDGDGTFATQVTYGTDPANANSEPVWITTADFNGDGHPDMVVANKASNNVAVLLQNSAGDGTFQPATTFATGTAPVSVVAAAFHSSTSSNLDLAVANQGDNSISIFQGNGNGTFATPSTLLQLPNGYAPAGMVATDVNADGFADLIVADQGNNSVSVFLGNGDGTFQNRTDYATGQAPVFVAVGDLNADGVVDLAIVNNGVATTTNSGDSVTILLGQKNSTTGIATGTFAPGTTRDFPAGNAPTSLVIADVNVDGLPDLVVTDGNTIATGATGDNAISVLIGGGDGTFSSNFELAVGTNPQSLVTEDFNDDAKPDIATANSGSNNVTVILNSSSVFNGNGSNSSTSTPYPSVDYIDLGLKLKATPRIHKDDVTLALELTMNSLSTQSFNTIPALNNESIKHTVRLKQDQTSMVASFISPQHSNNLNGTPGLGDLPGLQWLSQDQNVTNQDTEIIVLVTPRMVRYADREDRVVYAGQGALEGAGAAAPPPAVAAPTAPDQGAVPLQGENPPPAAAPGQLTPEQQGAPLNAPLPGQNPGQAGQQNPQSALPPNGQPQTPDQNPNPTPTQNPNQGQPATPDQSQQNNAQPQNLPAQNPPDQQNSPNNQNPQPTPQNVPGPTVE